MLKRCAYGRCFTTDGSELNCECGKAPAKASPATPLSRMRADEPVLEIIESSAEMAARRNRAFEDSYWRMKREHQRQDLMAQTVREHNARTKRAVARTFDLGPEFPPDARYWVE